MTKAMKKTRRGFDPTQVGWRIGTAAEPRAGALWCPFDRTMGVIGPQGSGKSLDLLLPALMGAPGAALTTLTKTDDLLITLTARQTGARATVVCDPFSQADGLPELIWDPILGCTNPMIAERRARAFCAGRAVAKSHSVPVAQKRRRSGRARRHRHRALGMR